MTAYYVDAGRACYRYLNQNEFWVPRDGELCRVAYMDPAWRYHAAALLLRRAEVLRVLYDLGQVEAIWGGTPARDVIGEVDGEPVYGSPMAPSPGSMAEQSLEHELRAEQVERMDDPKGWLHKTPLYQALVNDLPEDVERLAKHWSTCPVRTGTGDGDCTCRFRHLDECPAYAVNPEAVCRCATTCGEPHCMCRDWSPEWTL